MIEFKGITTYDGAFSYKNEANRNLANHGTEFNKLIGDEFVDLADSGQVSEIQQYEDKRNFIESNVDVITYNFSGKILRLELISGLNVDIAI